VLALLLLQWCHAGALKVTAKNIAKAVKNSALGCEDISWTRWRVGCNHGSAWSSWALYVF
jgi:hypothetical protein